MGKIEKEVADKGGRRMGIDRRQVEIDDAGEDDKRPQAERRSGKERRSGQDRRSGYSYRDDKTERRQSFRIK